MMIILFHQYDVIHLYKVTGVQTCALPVSLNLDFDFFSEAKSFFLTVLLRSFYLNLEFRQFVLFKSKQSRGTDVVSATRVPKLNVVLAKWQLLIKLERAPHAAEGIQCRFSVIDFRSAWISDLVLQELVCRS